jgi:hypothetical protein
MISQENDSLKSSLEKIDSYLLDIKTKLNVIPKKDDTIEDILFSVSPFVTDCLAHPVLKLKRLKYDPFSIDELKNACELVKRIEDTIFFILQNLKKLASISNEPNQEQVTEQLKVLTSQPK